MATNNKITFELETKYNDAGIKEFRNALTNLQTMTATDFLKLHPTIDIHEAQMELRSIKEEATKVEDAFEQAFNTDLGVLNLTKFKEALGGLDLNKLYTKLSAAGSAGEQAFRKIATEVYTANVQIKQSNKLLDNIATTFKNTIKWGISSSVWNNMTGSLQKAWSYTKNLDSSLNDIRIVSGQTADEMERFATQANQAAQALGSSTKDYTDASLIYYQQGLSTEDVINRTNITIKMANALGSSASEVSDYMTAIWNNFAEGSENLEYYADVITALGAATASSSEEIADGLEKFASIGNTVGLSYEYATAALATVVAQTRQSADTVGTAFKTLFARIQDLELGSTLDDGTTLGTYSEALAKIGVNIKDDNGELKDMNDILDEMGEKWQTLSSDTKVAVAQAVAGTRQYTQLVALMDNWDAFGENLKTATNATGTLEKQQETYMESISAHLEQLGAAGERLMSAFSDGFDINGMIDGLTNVVKLMANMTESVGGGQNALLLLGSTAAKVFSSQIAAGLAETSTGFRQAQTAASNLSQAIGSIDGNIFKDANSKKVTEFGERIANVSQYVNEQTKQQLNEFLKQYTDTLNQAQQAYDDYWNYVNKMANYDSKGFADKMGITDTTQKDFKNEEKAAVINDTFLALKTTVGEAKDEIESSITSYEAGLQAINEMNKSLATLTKDKDVANFFTNNKEKIEIWSKNLSAAGQTLTDFINVYNDKMTDLKISTKEIQDAANKFTNLNEVLTNIQKNNGKTASLVHIGGDQSATGIKDAFVKNINDAGKSLNKFKVQAEKDFTDVENKEKHVNESTGTIVNQMEDINGAARNLGEKMNGMITPLEKIVDTEIMVKAISSLGQLVSGFQALANVFDILNNEDLSTWEKVGQIISALSISIPILVNALTTLRGTWKQALAQMATWITASGTKLRLWREDTLKTIANTKAIDENTKAIIKNRAAKATNNTEAVTSESTSSSIASGLDSSIISGATVTTGGAVSTGASETMLGTGAALGEIAIAAVAVIAVLAIIIGITYAVVKAQNKYNDALKEAKQVAEDAKSSYDDLKSSYDDLKDSINDYQDSYDALSTLTKGTKEWDEAIEDLNNDMLNIITKYPELAKYFEKDSNGAYKLNSEGSQKLIDEAQEEVDLAYTTALRAQADVLVAENEKENHDLSKELASNWNNTIGSSSLKVHETYTDSSGNRQIYDQFTGNDLSPIVKKISKDITLLQDDNRLASIISESFPDWDDTEVSRMVAYLKKNSDKLNTLSTTTNTNLSSINDYTSKITDKILGDDVDTNTPSGSVEGNREQKLYDQEYKEQQEKWEDAPDWEVHAEYAEMKGWEYEEADFFGNWGKGSFTDENGDKQTVSDAYMRKALAERDAEENTQKEVEAGGYREETESYISDLNKSFGGLGDALAHIQAGEDLSKIYSKDELNELEAEWDTFKQYNLDKGGNVADKFGEIYDLNKDDIMSTFESAFEKGMTDVELQNYKENQLAQNSGQSLYTNTHSLEQGVLSGEITSENIGDNSSYNTIKDNIDSLLDTYPELTEYAEVFNNENLVGTQLWYEALEKIEEKADELAERDLKDDFDTTLSDTLTDFMDKDENGEMTLDIEAWLDSDDFEDDLDKILDAEYALDVQIHTNAEDAYEEIYSSLNNLQDANNLIGEGYKVSADNVRQLAQVYPGILENATIAADGQIQLNKKTVESAKATAKEEVLAQAEETAEELSTQAEKLRARQKIYQQMADAAGTLAEMDSLQAEGAAEQIATIEGGMADLKADYDQDEEEGNEEVATNSDENGQIVADNWNSAYQSAATSATEFAKVAVSAQKAAVSGNSKDIKKGDFKVNYSGSTGVSSEAQEIEDWQTKWNTIQSNKDSSGRKEQLLALQTKFQQQADSLGKQASDIEAMRIGVLAKAQETVSGLDSAGKTTSTSTTDNKSTEEYQETELDWYERVNVELDKISAKLKKLQTQEEDLLGEDLIKNLNEQLETLNDQIEKTQIKLRIANDEAGYYAAQLISTYGAQINSEGVLTNYADMYDAELARLNKAIAKYNSSSQSDSDEAVLDAAKERYEKFKELYSDYDNLISQTIPDLEQNILDAIDEKIELQVQEFDMELKIRLDLDEAKKDWAEFKAEVIDGIEDDNTLGNALLDVDRMKEILGENGIVATASKKLKNIFGELDLYNSDKTMTFFGANGTNDISSLMEDLKSTKDELQDAIQEYHELIDDLNDKVVEAIGNVKENLDEQKTIYDTAIKTLQHDIKLVQLLYGEDAYGMMTDYYSAVEDTYRAQYEAATANTTYWKTMMDSLTEGSEEWEQARDNWISSLSDEQSALESYIQSMTDTYINSIKSIFEELNDNITGEKGLDYINQEWELINDEAEAYLDTINAQYGIQELQNKYLDSINDMSNTAAQQKLTKIMNEQVDLLKEQDKLSQYDLDRADLKYQIALKELALEEAQENKSSMRLRRDTQGNYSYQYVADEDQVSTLTQELSDLYNQLYNLDTGEYADNLNEIYSIWTEYQEKMAEAAEINDPEERLEREELLTEYYGDRINNLVGDNEELKHNLYESTYLEMVDLYGEESDATHEFLTDMDATMSKMVSGWNSGLQAMTDKIRDEGGFESVYKKALASITEATDIYNDKITEAKTKLEDIKNGYTETTTELNKLNDATQKFIDQSKEDLGDVLGLRTQWMSDYADEIERATVALGLLAKAEETYEQSEEEQAEAASKNVDEKIENASNSDTTTTTTSNTSTSSAATTSTASTTTATTNPYASYPLGGQKYKIKKGDTLWAIAKKYYGAGSKYKTIWANNKDHLRGKNANYIYPGEILYLNTGGYTGDWADNSGKIAMLHKKELVLNATDTENLLSAVGIIRELTNSMANNLLNKMAGSNLDYASGSGLEQNVHIEATFPNVTSHTEIEEALNNLVNVASQRINER